MKRLLRDPMVIVALVVTVGLIVLAQLFPEKPHQTEAAHQGYLTSRVEVYDTSVADLYAHWQKAYFGILPAPSCGCSEDLEEGLQDQTNKVLTDPRSWAAAGVRFTPRDLLKQSASAVALQFRWMYPDELSRWCTDTHILDGCAITKLGHCDVAINIDLSIQAVTQGSKGELIEAINHEVGHCFGFDHTKKSVMEPYLSGDYLYPSTSEIKQLRHRLSS